MLATLRCIQVECLHKYQEWLPSRIVAKDFGENHCTRVCASVGVESVSIWKLLWMLRRSSARSGQRFGKSLFLHHLPGLRRQRRYISSRLQDVIYQKTRSMRISYLIFLPRYLGYSAVCGHVRIVPKLIVCLLKIQRYEQNVTRQAMNI